MRRPGGLPRAANPGRDGPSERLRGGWSAARELVRSSRQRVEAIPPGDSSALPPTASSEDRQEETVASDICGEADTVGGSPAAWELGSNHAAEGRPLREGVPTTTLVVVAPRSRHPGDDGDACGRRAGPQPRAHGAPAVDVRSAGQGVSAHHRSAL